MANTEFVPWPCVELSQYPLDSEWTDSFKMKSMPQFRYIQAIQGTRTMFQSPELASTYAQFRNYAFQQGAYSNANPLDMEFFYSMLSHDYAFFIGHKKAEIQAGFNFSDKKYEGLELVRASHFDLFRVEQATLGMTVLQSLTNPGIQRAFVSIKDRPKKGDIIFARLLPVGIIGKMNIPSVVEPWDTVDPANVDAILSVYRRQYEAFCAKFPDTSARAFMKICAYHFYELIQCHELVPILNKKLASISDFVHGKTISYTFSGKMPKLADIPGANPVMDGGKPMTTLATAEICSKKSVDQILREAIISVEDKTIEVTLFMHDAGDKFISEVIEPAFKEFKTTQKTHILDDNEIYRSLRHLSITREVY
ncbi:MAG: hypothetical protein IJU23_01785 [Proteobacteria bacterium]|nr:hypothetical protein [Pseudomonadota bacterium]